jgi:hypothetical protein
VPSTNSRSLAAIVQLSLGAEPVVHREAMLPASRFPIRIRQPRNFRVRRRRLRTGTGRIIAANSAGMESGAGMRHRNPELIVIPKRCKVARAWRYHRNVSLRTEPSTVVALRRKRGRDCKKAVYQGFSGQECLG